MKSELTARLVEFRDKGVTLFEMSKMLDVQQTTISRWIRNGKISPFGEEKLRRMMPKLEKFVEGGRVWKVKQATDVTAVEGKTAEDVG